MRFFANNGLLGFLLWVQIIRAAIVFPPLRGPHAVGTRRIETVDYSRQDPYAPSPQPRAPMLQLFYPISSTESLTPAPWLPRNSSFYAAQEFNLPHGILESIITGTIINGTAIFPLARKEKDAETSTIPILVFSPGAGGLVAGYTLFLSSLASFGYTIIGIDHPYDSDAMERPSGEVIFQNETQYHSNFSIAIITRRDDVLWLGTQITPTKLTNMLNLPQSTLDNTTLSLGIFGHSLGGNTANLAMATNSTPYKSSVSLDGPFFIPLNKTGCHGPFFYMGGTVNPCCHEYLVHSWPLISGWKRAVQIRDTTHFSFTDLVSIRPQLKGLRKNVPGVGTVDPERMVKVVTDYLKAFWGWSLEGQGMSDLLKGEVDEFPEIDWEDLEGNGDRDGDVLSDSWWGLRKQISEVTV